MENENTFRRHAVESSNNRAVRPGNDPLCITGYHLLWHGFALQGSKTNYYTDISAAPLDAPDYVPAGACEGSNSKDTGRRNACQQAIKRHW